MRKQWCLLVVAACSSSPPPSRLVETSTPREAAVDAVAPPAVMPARYLRTLEIDPQGYAPGKTAAASDLLLGDLLFHSPAIFGAKARSMNLSCNTCHPNGATHAGFFVNGISDRHGNVDLSTAFFNKGADDGVTNAVSIPSLRGCRFTAPYGLDGRASSLPEFIQGVVTAEFDGTPLRTRELAALVRYVQELDFLPNQNLDARGNLTEHANASAHRGAVLFAEPRKGFSGMSCASCHAPTSFFRDGRAHRLGTGASPSPHAIDGGYETPTLLGLAESAPYFHDGRFATIGEVTQWFDQAFNLGLSSRDRDDLTAYVESVGAVDRTRDDRPLARKLDETFAYASLFTADHSRVIWNAAVDAISLLLASAPPAMTSRASALRLKMAHVRETGTADTETLRTELSRLAADWAGSLSQ